MGMKKILSVFTAACLIAGIPVRNIPADASCPRPEASAAAHKNFRKIFKNISKIPGSCGKITGFRDKQSAKVIVNIQDLHCHRQAQENIFKIIEILDKNYNVKGIFAEGAYGKIDLSWLEGIKNKEMRAFIARRLFEEGSLGAAEYYALDKGRGSLLFGLENEQRHKENIKRLARILDRQALYRETLSCVQERIKFLTLKHTNERNKRFDKILDRHKKGKISSGKLYSLLYKQIEKIEDSPENYNNVLPVKISEYPNVAAYMRLSRLNEKTDFAQISLQTRKLLSDLKNSMPYESYRTFLEKTDNMKNLTALYEILASAVSLEGTEPPADYKRLDALFTMARLEKSINPVALIEEERRLTERLRSAFSYDETEREIVFLKDFYGYFSDYLQNRLMPEDFPYFKARFARFRELYSKYGVFDHLKNIEPDFEMLDAYYNLNNRRNEIFLEHIMSKCGSPNAETSAPDNEPRGENECLESAREIYIVVTGGYHSAGLSKLLEEKGLTNIVITPSVTAQTQEAASVYGRIIKEQSSFLRQALAFTAASQLSSRQKLRLLASAGAGYVEKAGYCPASVNALAGAIDDMYGGKNKVARIEYSQKQARIILADGISVTVQNDKGGVYAEDAPGPAAAEPFSDYGFAVKKALSATVKFLSLTDYRENADPYYFLKLLYRTAYENEIYNIFDDDGLSMAAEEFLKMLPETREIDGIPVGLFTLMPHFMQYGALSAHFKKRLSELEDLRLSLSGAGRDFRKVILSIMRLKAGFAESAVNGKAGRQLKDLFGLAMMFHRSYSRWEEDELKRLLSSRDIGSVMEWMIANTSMEMSDIEGGRHFYARVKSGKENITAEGVYGIGRAYKRNAFGQAYKFEETLTGKDHIRFMAQAFSRIFSRRDLSFFLSSPHGKRHGNTYENSPDLKPGDLRLLESLGGAGNIDPDLEDGFILGAVLHDYGKHIKEADDGSGRPDSGQHRRTGAVLAADLLKNLGFDDFTVMTAQTMIRHHDAFWCLYCGRYFEDADINYVTRESFNSEISESAEELFKTEKGARIGKRALKEQLMRMTASVNAADIYASGDRYISKRYLEFVNGYIKENAGAESVFLRNAQVFEEEKSASSAAGLSQEEKDAAAGPALRADGVSFAQKPAGRSDAMETASAQDFMDAQKDNERSFAKTAQKTAKIPRAGAEKVFAGKSGRFDITKAVVFFNSLDGVQKEAAVRLVAAALENDADLMSAEKGISFKDYENYISFLPGLQKDAIFKTAQKASVNKKLYESIARKMTEALWVKSAPRRNAVFERIKKAVRDDEKVSICFVHGANAEVSAAADIIMRQMLRDNNNSNFRVLSAGIMTREDGGDAGKGFSAKYALPQELSLIADGDIINSFSAREFGALHAASDFIVVAQEKHRRRIIGKYEKSAPEIASRIFLFGEINPDISDGSAVINEGAERHNISGPVAAANEFISGFFDYPPQDPPGAMLPGNKEKALELFAGGESPLKIAFYTATFGKTGEFVRSLNPVKFIKAHNSAGTRIGAAFVSLGGYAFFAVTLAASAPVLGALSIAAATAAAAAANIVLHTVMDYVYIKKVLSLKESAPKNQTASAKEIRKTVETLIRAVENDIPAKICFVCAANEHRSAAAHVLFEERMRKEGKTNIKTSSAGIYISSNDGMPMISRMKDILGKTVSGDILESFRTEYLADVLRREEPDFIVAAGEEQRRKIIKDFPRLARKVMLFSELAPQALKGAMPDPYAGEISNEALVRLINDIFDAAFAGAEEAARGEMIHNAQKSVLTKTAPAAKIGNEMPVIIDLNMKKRIFVYPAGLFLSSAGVSAGMKRDIDPYSKYILFGQGVKNKIKALKEGEYALLGGADGFLETEEEGYTAKAQVKDGRLIVSTHSDEPVFILYERFSETPVPQDGRGGDKKSAKAVLGQNLGIINEMAAKGKGAFSISLRISLKEFAKSFFFPAAFYKEHTSPEGKRGAAVLSAVSYAVTAAFVLAVPVFPARAALLIAAGIAAGALANIAAHIIIDYHYIGSLASANSVKEFGAQAGIDENGRIRIPIYIINEKPAKPAAFNFTNSAIRIDGSILWIGEADKAVVLYAEDAAYEKIAGEMASNGKLKEKIGKISRKELKKTLDKNNMIFDWIEVDRQNDGRDIDYTDNGNIRISYSLYKDMLDGGGIFDFLSSLGKIRKADAFTFARGIAHGLDDVSDIGDFLNYLRQHQKMGNGQMVVTYELVKKIGLDKFGEFLNAARKDGVQVFAQTDMREAAVASGLKKSLLSAGFAGHTYIVDKESGEGAAIEIYASGAKLDAAIAQGFESAGELERNLKNSEGFIIIKNSNLKKIINEERSGMYIAQLAESISGFKILKIFAQKPLTEEFVKNAARNFEMRDIPSLPDEKMLEFKKILKKNSGKIGLDEFVSLTELKRHHPVFVYIMKLRSKTKGDEKIINAFLEAVAEKMLAAEALGKAYKEQGLKDRELETVLARALLKSLINDTQNKGALIKAETLGRSMKEAQDRLNGAIGSLMDDAFENNSPEALNSIIELIPALAESGKSIEINNDINPDMNIGNYGRILSSA